MDEQQAFPSNFASEQLRRRQKLKQRQQQEQQAKIHLATARLPLQSLLLHQGPVLSVVVKTATPQVRLVLTSSADRTLALSTFAFSASTSSGTLPSR